MPLFLIHQRKKGLVFRVLAYDKASNRVQLLGRYTTTWEPFEPARFKRNGFTLQERNDAEFPQLAKRVAAEVAR